MEIEYCGSDRTNPPGAQSQHHQASVNYGSNHAQEAPANCQNDRFNEKQRADFGGAKAHRAQYTYFANTLFDTQLEE